MANETDWIHGSPYGHLHLRDFFAAFALAGFCAGDENQRTAEGTAQEAYLYADEMMRERELQDQSKR